MIVVTGENVVDLIPQPDGALRPALGGGPANIAVAAARLGAPVAMAARLGGDAFGAAFRRRLVESEVDGRYLRDSADPSTLALATIAGDGSARFDFWHRGAADFGWRDGELPRLGDRDIAHIGSLAAFLSPGADAVERWAASLRPRWTVTFDPNLRPISLAEPGALDRLDRLVALATLVKVSEDDLRLAYPGVPVEESARRWLAGGGPQLILLTRGSAGITAFAADGERTVPAPRVSVVDTIGAGDAAMGAVLVCLHERGAVDLDYVVAVAALACTRAGADAPTAAEVTSFLASAPVARTAPQQAAPPSPAARPPAASG
jgi:fructokinase